MLNSFYQLYGLRDNPKIDIPQRDPIVTVQYSRPATEWLRNIYGAKYEKYELHYKNYQIKRGFVRKTPLRRYGCKNCGKNFTESLNQNTPNPLLKGN